MPISINSNISAVNTQRFVKKSTEELKSSFEKLSSGKRINSAADDAAGLAIATDLLANAKAGDVASRNISDGVSAAAIADGGLQSASDITGRLSELATQAANGTLSDEQRSSLNQEYQALSTELDRIAQTTEFNGQKLLTGQSSISVQAGTDGSSTSQISLPLPGVSTTSLSIASTDISTQAGAKAALDATKAATQSIASSRADIGATVQKLDTAASNLSVSNENQRAAESQIRDVDVASETANLVKAKIKQQASVAVLAQANQQPNQVLKLLG